MESGTEKRDPEAIAGNLSELQSVIIQQYATNGTRNTKQLRKATGVDNTKVNYHMKRSPKSLVERGLVEFIGYDEEETTPGDGQPSEYAITELGERVRDTIRQSKVETEADVSLLDELAGRVERLEEERDQLQGRVGDLEGTLEKRTKALRKLRERVEGLES